MEIVLFEPSHYEAMAKIYMASYKGYIFDSENLRHRDAVLNSGYLAGRWTAIIKDKCIGFGEYSQTPEMGGPDIFLVNIAVHPDYQQRGAGTILYRRILDEVSAYQPAMLRSVCRSDHYGSIEFLQHRGFKIGMSILELQLVVDRQCENICQANCSSVSGIIVQTMADLKVDPNRDRKLYDLVTEIRNDIPCPIQPATTPYDQFLAAFVKSPSRLEEATFVAYESRSGVYVGISDLFADGKNGLLAGVTGVRREYKRRGIATVLKQRGLVYARDQGHNSITTFNAAENAAIAALNKRFGFIEKFTWLHFENQVSNR